MERKEEILSKFGKQLATLRKQKGLTVNELAAATRLDTARIREIEAGQVNLLFTTIMVLARGLGVNPDSLLKTL